MVYKGPVTSYREGASEVLPLQKRGGGKGFSHGIWGAQQVWIEVVLIQELEDLAVVMGGGGGAKSFQPLKGVCVQKVWRGAQTVTEPRFSRFVAPPPRN